MPQRQKKNRRVSSTVFHLFNRSRLGRTLGLYLPKFQKLNNPLRFKKCRLLERERETPTEASLIKNLFPVGCYNSPWGPKKELGKLFYIGYWCTRYSFNVSYWNHISWEMIMILIWKSEIMSFPTSCWKRIRDVHMFEFSMTSNGFVWPEWLLFLILWVPILFRTVDACENVTK